MKNKQTHTVQDIENLMFDYTVKIRDAKTKEEKNVLLKELRNLEKQFNNINDKNINGKKYPVKKQPKDIPKEELRKFLDKEEVKVREMTVDDRTISRVAILGSVDVSGVSPGSNRFTFIE